MDEKHIGDGAYIPEWNSGWFDDGGKARAMGVPLIENAGAGWLPDILSFAARSWSAGWTDMDAALASEDYVDFKREVLGHD